MSDLRIVDAPSLPQDKINDFVKLPTGGEGNYSLQLSDLAWYVANKENLTDIVYVDTAVGNVNSALQTHIADKDNPHQVTKAQVGLDKVNNTADLDKPVSNATRSAIIAATTDMATRTYVSQQDSLKADVSYVDTKVGAVSGGYFAAVDTLANLQAKTGMTTGQVAKVMRDPTASDNGDYYYNGSVWVKGYSVLQDANTYSELVAETAENNAKSYTDNSLRAYTKVYGLRSELDAVQATTGLIAQVARDPVLEKNGDYRYNGTEWVKMFDAYDASKAYANGVAQTAETNAKNYTDGGTASTLLSVNTYSDKKIVDNQTKRFDIVAELQNVLHSFTKNSYLSKALNIDIVNNNSTNIVVVGKYNQVLFNSDESKLKPNDFEVVNDRSGRFLLLGKYRQIIFDSKPKFVSSTINAIQSLKNSLYDPTQSINVLLIGDSITAGQGATGAVVLPNTKDLDTTRTNYTVNTYANLLRKHLVLLSGGALSNIVELAPNAVAQPSGYAGAWVDRLITVDSEYLKISGSGNIFGKSSYAYNIKTLILTPNSSVSVKIFGKKLSAIYTTQSTDTNGKIVLTGGGKTVEISTYSSTVSYKNLATVELDTLQSAEITVTNTSTTNLTIEGVLHHKLVAVKNNAISGTTTMAWLPESTPPVLVGSMSNDLTHVFVQLGTNDRTYLAKESFYENYNKMLDYIKSYTNNIIMMCPPKVADNIDAPLDTSKKFSSGTLRLWLKELANKRNIAIIDNYLPTEELDVNGEQWLADGLHPNDYGYKQITHNIKNAIMEA